MTTPTTPATTHALTRGACGFATGTLPLHADAWTPPADTRTCHVADFGFLPDDADLPQYPGERPQGSFVVFRGEVLAVRPDHGGCGWTITDPICTPPVVDLDAWLALRGQEMLGDRLAVLSYGSNLNPSQIEGYSDGRATVVLSALVVGAGSAYCTSQRNDGQYPAGLVSVDPAHVEEHGLVLVDSRRRHALDHKEGASKAGGAYAAGTVVGIDHPVDVVLEGGTRMTHRLPVYLQARRRTAARDGQPVLLAHLDQHAYAAQHAAAPFTGARDSGLDFRDSDELPTLTTEPIPVFVYGTLRPGDTRYDHIEDGVARHEPAQLRARIIATGADYPGLELSDSDGDTVDGVLLHPNAPGLARWMQLLDRIEGHPRLFSRVLCRVDDGRLAWVYVWKGERRRASAVDRRSNEPKVEDGSTAQGQKVAGPRMSACR
jgi:gamma-glutamylcyclotransferase (GGCT)/AIG2-like uncharacterized protein YtfP